MNLILKIIPCLLLLSNALSAEASAYDSKEIFSLIDLVNLAADLDTTFFNISKDISKENVEDETKTNNNKSIRFRIERFKLKSKIPNWLKRKHEKFGALTFKDVVTGNWDKDEHQIKSLEKTIKNMWRELNETSEEKATCLISLRAEMKKTETLTQHLTKALTKVKVTTKDYETLQSNYDELKTKYRNIETKARNYEKKYMSLDGRYMDLKLTNGELEKQVVTLTTKIENFESKQLEFDEETRSLKNKNTYIASRFDELERDIERYKMENARLEKKCSEVSNKFSTMKSKYEYERRRKCDYKK